MTMNGGGLVGQYFWYDEALGKTREFYRGIVQADLGGGYYLLEFSPHAELATGTREVVHVQRMAEEHWSFYDEPEQLMKAVDRGAT